VHLGLSRSLDGRDRLSVIAVRITIDLARLNKNDDGMTHTGRTCARYERVARYERCSSCTILIFEFEAKCHDIVMCNERTEFYDFTILSLFFHIDRIDLHDTIDITAYTLVSDKLEINETLSVAVLWAESVWGILRGLETFSQILAPSGDGPSVNIWILVFPYS